jgi:hypothetical protein
VQGNDQGLEKEPVHLVPVLTTLPLSKISASELCDILLLTGSVFVAVVDTVC